MARRGHQVLVLTASDRGAPYHEYKPGLCVKRFRSYRNSFRVDQRFALWSHSEIMTALKEFHPDVIHTHDPFQFAFSALHFGHRFGVPVILTSHQLPWFIKAYLPDWEPLRDTVEKILWGYSRWILPRFDSLIAPTGTIRNIIFQKTNIIPQVIGYGLDAKVFHPAHLSGEREVSLRNRLGLPVDVPILLHVGRLDKDKRVDLVVRAAARAMKHHPAHLVVIGDGTERLRLIELCSELGVVSRCHFPGFITLEDGLPDIYRMASVFVSASEIETQGLVFSEAAACGLPIVAGAATCIPEIVKNGVNGWLAQPGDVVGLAEGLRKLLKEPTMAAAMGRIGYRLSQGFTLERTFDDHQFFYMRLIATKASAYSSPAKNVPTHAKRSAWSG